jgi:hypothetical protein
MRLLSLILLLILSTSVFSSNIMCYSNGRLIYNGQAEDIYFNEDNMFMIKDAKTHKDVMIWATDCVIRL